MKRFLACAALAALSVWAAALASVAAAPESSTVTTRAADDVRRLDAEEVAAFIRGDADALARLWSDDFVVTNPLNKFVTKQQVLGMVSSGVLVLPKLERQIEYLRVYGDTAILAGSEVVLWGGKMPNAGMIEHLRITTVWMRQSGQWREVARHANVVPNP